MDAIGIGDDGREDMKRYSKLWHELVSFENLYLAYCKARKGKRNSRAATYFEYRLERELSELRLDLITESYRPGNYRTFNIHDGKPRLISAAPFRDRVVHHALCKLVEPIFERVFIGDSYASRSGKGTHAAVDRYQQFSRRVGYVLKCDIRKFFPSIDHEIVKGLVARKIKDANVLRLVALIVDGSNSQISVDGIFPGDDLLTSIERRRGLPIGNQTSQFFGNVMLNPLDHFVQDVLRCPAYIRYCDDFVLLSNDKRELADWRVQIERFLQSLRLRLHPTKRQISRTIDGLPFLGYRVFSSHRRLATSGVRRIRRNLKLYRQWFRRGRIDARNLTQRLRAWIAHADHANTTALKRRLFADTMFYGPMAKEPCSSGRVVEQRTTQHPFGEP